MGTLMEYKGFKAQVMEAERLVGDHIHGLPPGRALPVYYMDEFLNPPENWMRGPGVFIVPVRSNKGLWFNWRENSEINTAVLPTIKGCNPITGLQTSGFHLEKYEEQCPKHGCKFIADKFCPECNFKWPDRNYCSMYPLWWDGFRADGIVRQFFFTEEMLRDIATHLIGSENTVPAFGFAFYTPKELRKEIIGTMITCSDGEIGKITCSDNTIYNYSYNSLNQNIFDSVVNISEDLIQTDDEVPPVACSCGPVKKESLNNQKRQIIAKTTDILTKEVAMRQPLILKRNCDVSIGAGAKIQQTLNYDPYPLDSWKDKPDAVMTIYFVFQDKLEELIAGGMRDLSGIKEGMLQNMPIG